MVDSKKLEHYCLEDLRHTFANFLKLDFGGTWLDFYYLDVKDSLRAPLRV
jgi:hypothetical protein